METTQDRNQLSSNRQVELRVWLVRNQLSFAEIGRRIGGITGTAVMYLIRGDRMPVERHRQMVDLGIPAELLPVPQDVVPGRPMRITGQSTAESSPAVGS